MKKLFLKFTNPDGVAEKLAFKADIFTVGRHSENDLPVASGALSRRHLQIEKFGEIFVARDLNSSNGTKINGFKLLQPTKLKNGDVISLGDDFEMRVEIVEFESRFADDFKDFDDFAKPEKFVATDEPVEIVAAPTAAPVAASKSASKTIYFVAPLAAILILALIGGLIYLFSNRAGGETPGKSDEFVYSGKNERREGDKTIKKEKTENSSVETSPTAAPTIENSSANDVELPPIENPPSGDGGEIITSDDGGKTNGDAGESAQIERDSDTLLRGIALNDPRAFLTGAQQEIVKAKIAAFRNSAALAENIKSAKRSAAAIKDLAQSKSMKPNFLAVAALAKLGNNRGDALTAAQSMAEILSDLSRNIGNERADDNLLVIAAFDQGASGKPLAMRDMLQGLTDKFPGSSRRIRTIWFLRENKLISDAQFEFAIRFLAIGTIAQNPKNYGIVADSLAF